MTKTLTQHHATQPGKYQQRFTVGICFFVLALAFSARATLGLVMPVWQSELGWSRSFVSGAGAGALIVMAIVAPFAGSLVDHRGPRFTLSLGLVLLSIGCAIISATHSAILFVIAFSGISAIGFGIIATHVVSTAIARTFEHNRGLATGIATSGATGGQFLIVPLLASLLAVASWRWSFGGIALASAMLIPCILWLMPKAQAIKVGCHATLQNAHSFSGDIKFIVGRPAFHVLFWSFLLCGFTTTGVIETHFLAYASYCGFAPVASAMAYGLLCAVNMLGMIGAGWLTDRVNRAVLLAAIYLVRGATFFILSSVGSSIETLFVFAAVFGMVDYATVPVTASLVTTHVGLRVMGLAMGLISAGHSIGAALGAYLGGYIFDRFGSYAAIWTMSLWLAISAGILALLLLKQAHLRPGAAAASQTVTRRQRI
ncbi:MAG: MFS transporter [Methylococcaceae bacterium]|nr:MFS transporter [Methylococcaceae bacterium]